MIQDFVVIFLGGFLDEHRSGETLKNSLYLNTILESLASYIFFKNRYILMLLLPKLLSSNGIGIAGCKHWKRGLSLIPKLPNLKKIPQPPGYIKGTVNEPYKPPQADFYEGSYHWTYERIISVSLIPLGMSSFIGGAQHPIIDTIFSLALLFHCHMGLKSCIIDYVPKRVYGFWHKFASFLLTSGTFVGIYGIYLLETVGNGFSDLIKSLWGA